MSRFGIQGAELEGLAVVERTAIGDERGFLSRIFCTEELRAAGWDLPISQINHALTKVAGTVRGMHFQYPPKAEAKLVSCLRGAVWDVAVDQHGYITLDDAERLGISQPTVGMLAHRGTLEHLARGVCRFVDLPVSPASPNLAVVLWTGQPRACLSHDTALNELCDINPGRIHVTVPKGRRIRCKSGR